MDYLISQIDNIISNCNNKINEKVIGINYLEQLKYLLIDDLQKIQLPNISNSSLQNDNLSLTKNYGDNYININIQIYKKSVSSIKNICLQNHLSVVLSGFKSIDLYDKEVDQKFNTFSLFPKMGIVLGKDLIFSQKITKESLIIDVYNPINLVREDLEKK